MYLPRAIVQTVFSSTKLILKTKSVSPNSVGGSFLCSCKTLGVTISIMDETTINLETNYTRSCYPRENSFEKFVWQFLLLIFFLFLDVYFYERVKGSLQAARLDLYVNGEILSPNDDKRLISQVPLRDRTVSIAVFTKHNASVENSTWWDSVMSCLWNSSKTILLEFDMI